MPYYYEKTIVHNFGERGSGISPKGSVQDFYRLRDSCLENNTLFEDENFPADRPSIYYSQYKVSPHKWKRPNEIVANPLLVVDGPSRFDVVQGGLDDSWVLASMANLSLHKNLFHRVVPDDQGFGDKYAGIFHFRIWQFGRWIDVVIDDRIPTVEGKPAFAHSTQDNEFWSALLEKAYAKIHGSYEALVLGTAAEAMEDFTGGISEILHDLSAPNLYQVMLKSYERASLLAASIEANPWTNSDNVTSAGLVTGHLYSITMVRRFSIPTSRSTGIVQLIRIRNPWGNATEWKGPWSDTSQEWSLIPERIKKEIGLTVDTDGEFWMSFEDFKSHFTTLQICSLDPGSVQEGTFGYEKKRWEMSMFEGEWVSRVTAGGLRNTLETFFKNPQYRITLEDTDEDDDENKCTVVIALMQKNWRPKIEDHLHIAFHCYHLRDPDKLPKPLGKEFFDQNESIARTPSYFKEREVNSRFKLPPGVYCIVPSTFELDKSSEFILRVFSEKKHNMKENDIELHMGEMDERLTNAVPQPKVGESRAEQSFLKIAGKDREVDWLGLKEVLDSTLRPEIKGAEFSKEVCRSLVVMKDFGKSGKLRYEEFKCLWKEINDWKTVFKMYEKDGSGYLNVSDLRQAMNSAGFRLKSRILNILVRRYGTKKGMMSFDDFLMCNVKLKELIEMFKERDPDDTNSVTFTMDEWILNNIYS
ncbi:calpain-B-like [Anabrus simplex]|uniref:calpain-B-like n=1 Tax=Anabrus simplex TaxID=316456 RepID=UPI0035A3D54E